MPHVLGYRSPSGYGYPGLGSVLDITAPGTAGLIGHWIPVQRQGGTGIEIAGRSTVLRNDIVVPTRNGLTINPSSRFGYVWDFNGTNRVTFYDTATALANVLRLGVNGTNRFTMGAWIKTTSAAEQNISGNSPNNGSFQVWHAAVAVTTGKFVFEVRDSSHVAYTATSGKVVNDGQWHHVVGTWDKSFVKCYVDGNLEASTAYSNAPPTSNDEGMFIGDLAADANRFNGQITHFMLWQRCLQDSEIKMLHQDPFIMYLARGIIPEAIPVPSSITSTHWSQFGVIKRLVP